LKEHAVACVELLDRQVVAAVENRGAYEEDESGVAGQGVVIDGWWQGSGRVKEWTLGC